jgi:hypothetical protein
MKRLEAILSRNSLELVTGLLMEHGCEKISLFKSCGGPGLELADPTPSAHRTNLSWVRIEAMVGDAEALPTVQAILHASHGQTHSDHGLEAQTEPVSSIAVWNVEAKRSALPTYQARHPGALPL